RTAASRRHERLRARREQSHHEGHRILEATTDWRCRMRANGFGRVATVLAVVLPMHATPRRGATTETVMVTYHAKRGAESDLAKVLADHWSAARRLDLVQPEPHIVVRPADSTQPADLVEIFTWRDANTPDNAPQPIRDAWTAMGKLVESRGGRPAIEI